MALSVFNFTQLFSKAKKRCSQRALTRNPTVLSRLVSREPERMSAQTLYCQKLESLKIWATESTCLSLLVSTQLFFESRTVWASQTGTKTEFNTTSPLKVTCFEITEKLTMDCVSQYSNAGLTSKVSEQIAKENAENCHCRQPHCHLTPSPQGTSANICINLISPETRVMAYIFAPIIWVYLHSSFVVGLEMRIFSGRESVSAIPGHPRSLILAPIEGCMRLRTSH